MRIILSSGLILLVAGFCSACANADEIHKNIDIGKDVSFQHIENLEEVQGCWTIAPEGVGMYAGEFLVIKGGRCRYRQFTDAGRPPLKEPIEFDVALAGGVLVLKTDNPHVQTKMWRLGSLGEHKCLVAFDPKKPRAIVNDQTSMLYYRSCKGEPGPVGKSNAVAGPTPVVDTKPVGGAFKQRFPPKPPSK